MHRITTLEQLDAMYGEPVGAAVTKEIDYISDHYKMFIDKAPFVVVATVGPEGLDCSPRGDPAGFVRVQDEHTLLIPDRRGNNRLDTLHNLVRNPKVGLLFLVPGVTETFRINGEAVISRDPALTDQFIMQGKAPRTVIVVTVKEAYIQCSRALVRSDIWNPAKHALPGTVPSMGTVMAKHTCGFVDAKKFDEEAKERVPVTLY